MYDAITNNIFNILTAILGVVFLGMGFNVIQGMGEVPSVVDLSVATLSMLFGGVFVLMLMSDSLGSYFQNKEIRDNEISKAEAKENKKQRSEEQKNN